MLPAIILVGYIGIELWSWIPTLMCAAVLFLMLSASLKLTRDSWRKHKVSGFKLTIIYSDVLGVMFYIAGASAIVALVSGLFNFDSITMPSLCVFTGAGVVCFLITFVEMLFRRD